MQGLCAADRPADRFCVTGGQNHTIDHNWTRAFGQYAPELRTTALTVRARIARSITRDQFST